MAVLEDQAADAEGGADGEQVGEDAEGGNQRRLQRDQQEQEAEGEDDADHERRLRGERLLEVAVLGGGSADEGACGECGAQAVDRASGGAARGVGGRRCLDVVDPAQWADFMNDRQGCVIGVKLAKRFGWTLGTRIPLKAPGYLGGGSWDFNVRAIYHGTRQGDDETQLWLRHDYFYEKAPSYWRGIVGWYVVRVANPNQALAVARAIDAEFGNSASETRTQTESAFAAGFMQQMGNIEFLLLAIGGVVFFTLLLVTGNTMAIAVRERTGELAVLKAIGFSDRFVLGLVLTESLLIAVIGGALGLWLAHAVTEQDITSGLLLLYLPPIALVGGVAFAVGTGLLAGVLPAIGAMRLNVATALRRV